MRNTQKNSALAVFFLCAAALFVPAATASMESTGGVIPGQYIVVLDEDLSFFSIPEVANEMARIHAMEMMHLYRHALKGFSARIPERNLEALRLDPRVRFVDADRTVRALPSRPGTAKPGKGKPGGGGAPPDQTVPFGVMRINADTDALFESAGNDVDIAVIDTGIDLDHPDLNVVDSATFVSSKSGDDDNGHGTHVAGTAAAKDNLIGVVGVAPGARLWAVKVLNRRGSGSWSSVIAGIDYVTANADEIEVANMSLGGFGDDGESSLHTAIINSVAAGVTYVVAAGNEDEDAKNSVPASFDEVITVSAIADSDGLPGGEGDPTFYGADDHFASFSNYGADVDIAAPGVDIFSTYKGGDYRSLSGTSMASPHVAGAAARYIAGNPGSTPAEVLEGLLDFAVSDSFPGDPDPYPEPLVEAGSF